MFLSRSVHLFQCTLQLIKIYKDLIEPHFDYCSAVWDDLMQQLSEKLVVLSELWLNLAMIWVPDIFLTRLVGTIYRLEGLNKRLILMYVCINYLAQAYLCNLFALRTPNYYFRIAKKNLMLPKPRTDYLKRSFSYSGALPEEIRTSNSVGVFKRSSFRWFSDQYSHTTNM